MVKIKTSPETKNKVTLTDLNSNIVQLTQALNKNATALNTAGINNLKAAALVSETNGSSSTTNSSSSSTKNKEASWYTKAGQAAWKSSELNKQSSNIGSSFVGGLTGISPAVVQRLGIDKAIGSILKSTLSGIKKKWTEAGKSSNNTKVNSAVESNKISPITKRLDKIVGLLKGKKSTKTTEAEKKDKGIFGKLLSFFGGMLKAIGPLLKLGGLAALIAGLTAAINKLADIFGTSPKNVVEKGSPIVGGLGSGIKEVGAISDRLLKNEAAYKDALKKLKEDEYYKKLSPKERAKEIKKPSKKAPREFIRKLEEVNRTREQLYDTKGVSKRRAVNADIRADKASTRMVEKRPLAETSDAIKYKTREIANRTTSKTGKLMNTIAIGGEVLNTGIDVYNDVKTGNTDKIGPDILKGGSTITGMLVGGNVGAAVGGKVLGVPGALAGGVIGAGGGAYAGGAMIKKLFPEQYEQATLEDLMANRPDLIARPALTETDKLGLWEPGLGDGVISHGWDLLNKYAGWDSISFYKDWIKGNPTFMYGHTPKELDPHWMAYVYAQGKMGKAMPTDIPRSAYLTNDPNTTFEEIYEQGLSAYRKNGGLETTPVDPTKSVSYPQFTTPVYGLTTDFDSPISAADEAALPTEEIAANTKTTNDYLQDILNAITDMKGTTPTNDYLDPKKPNIDWLGKNEENANAPSFPGLTWMYSHGQHA